jgi:DHA1 family 2-module integral membrane pump EmrD-like MFS transporter
MLIGGLAGVAVFEACSGVLLGARLGLSSMVVSILFILPIPAAFFGAWFAGRPNKRFSTLMWQSVTCCLVAGLMMWIPGLFDVMNVWTLLVPAALFFFGAGMLFPLATSGAMEPSRSWQAPLARWLGDYRTLVPACWRGSLPCCRRPGKPVWAC